MKNWRARITIPITVMAAAALAGIGGPAVAAQPEKSKPGDINYLVPAGEACEFPLQIVGTDANANVLTFRDKTGDVVRVITAGRGYTLTYSRLDKKGNVVDSLTLQPTGSVSRIDIAPDGTQTVVGTGTNGLVMFSTDVPPSSAVQYQGRIVFTIDPTTGVFTLVSSSGKQLNICEALA